MSRGGRRGLEELAHPVALRQGAAVGVGGEDLGRRREVRDRAEAEDVAVLRAAVQAAHVEPAAVRPQRILEHVAEVEDRLARVRRAQVVVHAQEPGPEVVVVAAHLVPGDLRAEPGRVVGVEEGGARRVVSGAPHPRVGVDALAVQHVDVPAQFVVLRVVARVAEGDAEVDRVLVVQRVDRAHGGVEHVVGVEHHAGVRRREKAFVAEEDRLGGRLHVGDVDVADGEEAQEPAGGRGRLVVVPPGQQVEPALGGQARRVAPASVAVLLVLRELVREDLLRPGRRRVRHDHALRRRGHGGGRVLLA